MYDATRFASIAGETDQALALLSGALEAQPGMLL
jgi:hypothetical protein